MSQKNVDLLQLVKGGDIIPRFVSNGFDIGEIEETLEGIRRTEDWAPEWARLGERHAGLAEAALQAGHALTAGETFIRASLCHHYAQFLSFEANEEKRGNQGKKIALYTRALPLTAPPIEKVRIPFEGVSLPGYFRVPQSGAGPRACVLGRSFGGHLVPRSAAHDSWIRACVSMGGYLDTSFYRWEEPLRRIRFQFLCGKENLEETKALAARFTLPRRAERIKCPVLAVHGERDHGVPGDQAEKIVRGCAGEATLLSLPTGNHVCHNMTRYVFAHVSDWMEDRLGKGAG
ncbi:MAG: prolyl oligopeptidase family serine peptidase [Nitrospinota bacterium]|nr:prolyl oligopeptidase family serine peptidase [Nitrospinota bacterium]HJM42006.1 prolyl oligopeptidase family serine peptidase [Nitrospinota bacterium]